MVVDRVVVLIVPIVPAATGNGLAMRGGMLLDALAPDVDVHVVVVPVAGPVGEVGWSAERAQSVSVVDLVAPTNARDHTTAQLADPVLRSRLEQTVPLPLRAALAPPTFAAAVRDTLPDQLTAPAAVLAMRLYLAPLGIHLAVSLGADRVVVDADDDDSAVLRGLGEPLEADAFARLARCWLPLADAVLAASPVDAAGIAAAAGLDTVGVVPNTVTAPETVTPPPGHARILFVGNLTYEPNRRAVGRLVTEILPGIQAAHPAATLDLVGPHDASLGEFAGAPGVRLLGAVPEVAPFYADADVVVVPLSHGGGTRIKVLEAFAHGRPVVATPVAMQGLDVEPGRDALVAESTDDLVQAVGGVLARPEATRAMVERAATLVRTRYSRAAVAPLVQAAVLGMDP